MTLYFNFWINYVMIPKVIKHLNKFRLKLSHRFYSQFGFQYLCMFVRPHFWNSWINWEENFRENSPWCADSFKNNGIFQLAASNKNLASPISFWNSNTYSIWTSSKKNQNSKLTFFAICLPNVWFEKKSRPHLVQSFLLND